MIIREAKIEDIPAMIEAGKEYFLDIAKYNHEKDWSVEEAEKILKSCIKRNGGIAIIAEKNKEIFGMGIACLTKPLFSNQTQLTEIVWHAKPEFSFFKRYKIMERVLEELENFARVNYSTVALGVHEDTSLKRFLEKRGYKPSEIIYKRKVV